MRNPKFPRLLILVLCLALLALFVASLAGPNQPVSAHRSQGEAKPASSPSPAGARPAPDFSKSIWDLPADAADTKNPVASSDEAIAKGRELFMTRKGNCAFCHGDNGAGNDANFAKLRRRPADLSRGAWMVKLSDGEIYWKITRGIPGIMPASDDPKMTAEERWQLVNFVRSLAKPAVK